MKAAQAWQAALGQLQLEMPKAAFDTWVRDTEFIGFDEQTYRFTIASRDAFARDWLEDRLTSTVQKLLAGIMNGEVTVQFVVHNDIVADDPEDDDANDDSDDSETSSVEAVYDLPYDEIVGNGIVSLPAYFEKHLADLGPVLGWLVVGFRQSAYFAGQRKGLKRHRISERQIELWSGTHRRTFRRKKKDSATWAILQGFVEQKDEDVEATWQTGSAGEPHRRALAYRVHMTMPLTAAHTYALEQWLVRNVETAGGPTEVIELALTISPRALLPDDAVPPNGAIRKTVPLILQGLFSEQLSKDELVALSHRLHYHIMPRQDQIQISHFFIRNLLPLIGQGPAWALTLLRDRCYIDPVTGDQRNEIVLQSGWQEIADWVKVKPMTVWRWLHGTRRKDEPPKFPPLSLFLHEAASDTLNASQMDGKRIFHVSQDEFTPEIIDILNTLEIEASRDANWQEIFAYIFSQLLPAPPNEFQQDNVDNSRANVPNGDEGLARLSPIETQVSRVCPLCSRANVPNGLARLSPNSRANVPILSSLNSLKTNSLNSNKQNIHTGEPDKNTPNSKTSQVGGFVGDSFSFVWDWEFLFAYNPEISPQDRDKLIERDPLLFVTWLIYGYSRKGEGLTNPVMYAVRQTQRGLQEPAEFVQYRNMKGDHLHGLLASTAFSTDDRLLPQDDKTRTILRKRLFGPKS